MALHRYGGGCSAEAVGAVLQMPFAMLVRLVGAAKRATEARPGGGGGPRGHSRAEDEAIIRAIEKKEAELLAARNAAPAPA